jgi:hypothetical protein
MRTIFLALRCAAHGPAAQGRLLLFTLPSTYPVSAQARLGDVLG